MLRADERREAAHLGGERQEVLRADLEEIGGRVGLRVEAGANDGVDWKTNVCGVARLTTATLKSRAAPVCGAVVAGSALLSAA